MGTLAEILAVERQTRSEGENAVTDVYHAFDRAGEFTGLEKTYSPILEEGEQFPPESATVQRTVTRELDKMLSPMVRWFDVVATRDEANRHASAVLTLEDGTTLFEGREVPAVTLLFLESELERYLKLIGRAPLLDAAQQWTDDANLGLKRSDTVKTGKTKKTSKVVVLYEATVQHPAQVKENFEDVLVGYWDTTKFSGAISAVRKAELLNRVESFLRSVKKARSRANAQAVQQQEIGAEFFTRLFA